MLITLIIIYVIAFIEMILSFYYLFKISNLEKLDNVDSIFITADYKISKMKLIFDISFLIIHFLYIFCIPIMNIWIFSLMIYDWRKERKEYDKKLAKKVMNKLLE